MKGTGIAIAIVMFTGCVVAEDEQALEAAAMPTEPQCDDFLCTGNSPIVGGVEFWRLDKTKTTEFMGFRITAMTRYGIPLTDFDINGADPKAWAGSTPISGILWKDTRIHLATPKGPLIVTINDWRNVDYYDGGPGPVISAFKLQYQAEPGLPQPPPGAHYPWKDVCDHTGVMDGTVEGTWAILSQGDDFDKVTTSITASGLAPVPTGVGPWFNVSCAGDVISKLIRIRHAFAVTDAAHPTTKAQRQAGLRMFTSKVCPLGPLFTHKGVHLKWEDRPGWSPLTAPITTDEGIWNENGATCLVNPREYPLGYIMSFCRIPICSPAVLAGWRARPGQWLRSYNY
jgi:hypothetical protein